MRTDGRRNMTKVIVAFRNFPKAPKIVSLIYSYALLNTTGTTSTSHILPATKKIGKDCASLK